MLLLIARNRRFGNAIAYSSLLHRIAVESQAVVICVSGIDQEFEKNMSQALTHMFTPLKNPPRCAVSTIRHTPNSSRGRRYAGRTGDPDLRARQCIHHEAITKATDIQAASKCHSKIPLILSPSSAKCH